MRRMLIAVVIASLAMASCSTFTRRLTVAPICDSCGNVGVWPESRTIHELTFIGPIVPIIPIWHSNINRGYWLELDYGRKQCPVMIIPSGDTLYPEKKKVKLVDGCMYKVKFDEGSVCLVGDTATAILEFRRQSRWYYQFLATQ